VISFDGAFMAQEETVDSNITVIEAPRNDLGANWFAVGANRLPGGTGWVRLVYEDLGRMPLGNP
jgi:hypothetical protein